jgi:hypothetical protein
MIWRFHGGHYEECLLRYKTPVPTSQETHYVSTTESSHLMLCKIWGFHGGDYEEWRLLGYRNPIRTSQETHYVSTTQSSQLMLCKIWGFHGGDYEDWRLLGCYGRVALVETDVSEDFVCLRSACRLLVTANVVPSSPILVTLMMEAFRSSETSALTRATWRNIPEDGILQINR